MPELFYAITLFFHFFKNLYHIFDKAIFACVIGIKCCMIKKISQFYERNISDYDKEEKLSSRERDHRTKLIGIFKKNC